MSKGNGNKYILPYYNSNEGNGERQDRTKQYMLEKCQRLLVRPQHYHTDGYFIYLMALGKCRVL